MRYLECDLLERSEIESSNRGRSVKNVPLGDKVLENIFPCQLPPTISIIEMESV